MDKVISNSDEWKALAEEAKNFKVTSCWMVCARYSDEFYLVNAQIECWVTLTRLVERRISM